MLTKKGSGAWVEKCSGHLYDLKEKKWPHVSDDESSLTAELKEIKWPHVSDDESSLTAELDLEAPGKHTSACIYEVISREG